MSEQEERITPEQLSFQLEEELGEILTVEQFYPDVYHIAAKKDEADLFAAEYYVVLAETKTISQTVKNYGKPVAGCPELLLYPLADDKSGWRLVDYEGRKCMIINQLQLPEYVPLHETAVFDMEYHPEYFGAYPAPMVTPLGYTLRYKALDNGIYWLETDQCKQMLAVCYPIWSTELSDTALALGRQTEYDRTHGIANTFGCLFFAKKNSCIPLFELLLVRDDWKDRNIVNGAALMNAVWLDFPEYAADHNLGEQAGTHDLLGLLMNEFGIEVEMGLSRPTEHMIAIFPKAGTDFICW